MIVSRGPLATPDELLVQKLVAYTGGRGTTEFIEPNNFFDDMIIVGGQLANPIYDRLVKLGYVPSIREETVGFGTIYYTVINNHKVWVIAGWAFEDTQHAVDWVLENGLPPKDT